MYFTVALMIYSSIYLHLLCK